MTCYSILSSWKKQDLSIQRTPGGRLPGGGVKVIYGTDCDNEIMKWILEQRDLHISVTSDDIMNHARNKIQPKPAGDGFNNSWHVMISLRQRTNMSQKLPADLEDKISSFHLFV